jgi:hypothetical protein
MDHIEVLKRAFKITWRHRALWLFGILLALTGGGGRGFRFSFPGGDGGDFGAMPEIAPALTTAIAVALIIFILVLIVGFVIVRYVTQTALIGMVKEIEGTGTTSVKSGFRTGWSRSAFRLFLINLVIGIPMAIVALLLLAFAASPLLLLFVDNIAARIIGVMVTVGLVIVVIILLVAAGVVISVLTLFFQRQCVLGEKGVIDSIRDGYWMVRRNLGEAALMWLLMLGVGIGWVILLIPVTLIIGAFAFAAGALPGGLIYLITGSEAAGFAIGGIIGVVVLSIPLIFVNGLYLVFQSCVWTLTYLEIEAGEPLEATPSEVGATTEPELET